jgi:hypothetical protein
MICLDPIPVPLVLVVPKCCRAIADGEPKIFACALAQWLKQPRMLSGWSLKVRRVYLPNRAGL